MKQSTPAHSFAPVCGPPPPLLSQVGIIRISNFSSSTPAGVRDAIAGLKAAGTQAYVLDLRSDGGGSFPAGLEVARMFLDKARRTRSGQTDRRTDGQNGQNGQTDRTDRRAAGRATVCSGPARVFWVRGWVRATVRALYQEFARRSCRHFEIGRSWEFRLSWPYLTLKSSEMKVSLQQ